MSLPLNIMSFDTYGLSEEKFLDYFSKQSRLILRSLKMLHSVAAEEDVKLGTFGSKFVWDVLQEAAYGADDACRVQQREDDPEEIKRRSYDPMVLPTREDMMAEIQSLNAKMEAIVDYLSSLAKLEDKAG
jgi:hypothetical protein